MASEFLDPSSNINELWFLNAFTNIDGGTRQPSVPTTDVIRAIDGDESEEQIYGMTNLVASYSEITSIVVWTYANATGSAGDATCRIKVGGVFESAQNVGLTGSKAWHSITFNSSWTQSDVDALEVSFIASSAISKADKQEFDEMYVEITGTLSGVGTNIQINIGDSFKSVDAIKINIGDNWKNVTSVKQNIGDVWKDVF